MRRARASSAVRAVAVAGCALACATHSDALARGQRYYEENQYERALALWRDLDRRGAGFEGPERARFAYFRGMTDYRLGYRDDARHWLAIARATEEAHPGALGSVWLERLDSALTDLAQATRPSGQGPDAVQTIEAPPDVLPPGVRDAAQRSESAGEPGAGLPEPGAPPPSADSTESIHPPEPRGSAPRPPDAGLPLAP